MTRETYEKREAARRAELAVREAEEAALCRPAFVEAVMRDLPEGLVRDFDLAKHPNVAAHNRALAWPLGPIGLMLTGPTGRGKSRTLLKLIERLAWEDQRVRYWSVPRLADRISSLALASSTELDRALRSLETCDILALDDAGAHRPTERVAAALHRVIDSRYAAGKPLLVTTNCSPTELQAQLLDQHGRSVRRIREMTQAIAF